jgi:hypothetical protein
VAEQLCIALGRAFVELDAVRVRQPPAQAGHDRVAGGSGREASEWRGARQPPLRYVAVGPRGVGRASGKLCLGHALSPLLKPY